MFWIILGLVIVGFVVYKLRVPLLAKLLGQSEHRVERRLNRGKD